MKNGYEAKDLYQAMAHVVEECGEVIAAAGKSFRFGATSVNPELPTEQQETNFDWFLREVNDLERAIKVLKVKMIEQIAQTKIP